MTTVQTAVTDNQSLVPFFYLRITGLPFYVFATVDPSAARYGAFAWSTPTGFPSTWAQRGMMLPNDAIAQKFTDIIGGIASPARCTISVMDFPDPTHQGYGYFSRLFATGRALTDTTIPRANLAVGVTNDGSDTVVSLFGSTASWPDATDVYLGAETIGTGANTDLTGGAWELEIIDRNKYVCFGNSGDGGTYWPPTPYHRVLYGDASLIPIETPAITGDVVEVLGRTAALWMGHMRPDGNPEPESSSACLLLGRVTGLEIGKVGGMFDIALDSIVDDLTKAVAAPDLATATIRDGYYLSTDKWCSFFVGAGGSTFELITIPTGIYTSSGALARAINDQLQASADTTVQQIRADTSTDDSGQEHWTFTLGTNGTPLLSSIPAKLGFDITGPPSFASLLYALGFDVSNEIIGVDNAGTATPGVVAPRPIARVFVPLLATGNAFALPLREPGRASYFFNDQRDGSTKAWARLGDGQIPQLVSIGVNTVTLGLPHVLSRTGVFAGGNHGPDVTYFYYVEAGDTPTIDQVIVAGAPGGSTISSYTQYMGALLASTTGVTTDGILNVLPTGVGLGWSAIMTASEWLQTESVGRYLVIDNTTTWKSVFTPYAREHGLFLVWDPSAGRISLRRIRIPQKANGSSTVVFSESNRAKDTDRTSQKADLASLRTSWTIKLFYAVGAGVTKAPTLTVNNVSARSMYPNDQRQESIEDKSALTLEGLIPIVGQLTQLYGSPWTLCSRSMNKRGMLLAPGTIHQVVDNTMVNPFTGASSVTAGDAVYCFLTRVSMVPSTGEVTVDFVVNSTDDNSLYRQWSPCGLIDFDATTHGYIAATKTLTMKAHFGASGANDALSFAAGDTVYIRTRDNSDVAAESAVTATIASTGATTIVLTTDIVAVSSTVESIVTLQKYNSATTARKTGATRVAWQGSGDTRLIQGTSGTRLNRWA